MMDKKSTIIQCENVTLGYDREPVLENISLEIPAGVFIPFVGPNGAGKTTLLRGILGLIEPMKGRVRTPFDRVPAGYVPQHKAIDALIPLTVREIILMGLYPELGWWKRPDRNQRLRMDEAISELKLEAHAHKNYRDLSGGTKQKTLVARAFVSGADVFIMDEPTAELDEASEREVFHHLSELVRKHGKTVLIAHHGLSRLLSEGAAEQVCVVNHGKVSLMNIADFRGVL